MRARMALEILIGIRVGRKPKSHGRDAATGYTDTYAELFWHVHKTYVKYYTYTRVICIDEGRWRWKGRDRRPSRTVSVRSSTNHWPYAAVPVAKSRRIQRVYRIVSSPLNLHTSLRVRAIGSGFRPRKRRSPGARDTCGHYCTCYDWWSSGRRRL